MTMNINTQNINFTGAPSRFTREFQKYTTDAIKDAATESRLTELFKDTVELSIKPENKLGSGEFGSVYKIDDEFVFKTNDKEGMHFNGFSLENNPVVQKLKTYYGNIVAKFGNVKLLKNAASTENPTPAGVIDGINDYGQKMAYYRDVYLKKFASLPQKAFDDIAADFKTISGERKSFDTINPNNFVADGNAIKITDDLQTPDGKFLNSLAGMAKVFINSLDRNTKADYDILAVGSRRELLRKIILAGEKNELNFGSTMPEKAELNTALELCNIQTPWRDVQADLCEFRRRCPNMDERLKKVNEYFDELIDESYSHFWD